MDTPNTDQNILPSLPEDNIPPLLTRASIEQRSLNPEKVGKALRQLKNLEHGAYASVPLYCKGDACHMAKTCPFMIAGIEDMIGGPCPLETHLIGLWLDNYVGALKIDRNNIVEMSLAQEVAKIDIYERRMNDRLAYEDVVTKQVVGVTEDGTVQYRNELHISAQWLDVLSKRKLKLLSALLATRESVAKAGGGQDTGDPSSNAGNILSLLNHAKKTLQKKSDDLKANNAKPIN